MATEFLNCPFCLYEFNSDRRLPFIIVECGHSICQTCLSLSLKRKSPIACPEDQTTIRLRNRKLTDFPKNQALLNMMGKKSESRKSCRTQKENNTALSINVSRNFSERVSLSNRFNNVSSNEFGKSQKTAQKLGKGSKNPKIKKIKADLNCDSEDGEVCRRHHMRREVVCTDISCQVRICYQCGLFGEHSVG